MDELHYLHSRAHMNIYCLSPAMFNGSQIAVVACQNDAFVAYFDESGNMLKEELAVFPVDHGHPAEVNSVHAFNQLLSNGAREASPTVVASVSHPLKSSSSSEKKKSAVTFELRIYGSKSPPGTPWINLIDDGQVLPLDFIPFGIYHVEVRGQCHILVPGSDQVVHVYSLDDTSRYRRYLEVENDVVPELLDLHCSLLSLDTVTFDNIRVTTVGGQDGRLSVFVFENGMLTRTIDRFLDGPVSQVKLWVAPSATTATPSDEGPKIARKRVLHLAAGVTVGYALLYCDILNQGFLGGQALAQSDSYDSVLTVGFRPADPVLSSPPQVVVGTYGRRLLGYSIRGAKYNEVELSWSQSVAHPVFSIAFGKFAGQAWHDMLVASLSGLHHLQETAKINERRQILEEIDALRRLKKREGGTS
eukprot:TRINITY_DN10712_c0_g1_i1.p1 TRINITY_DN10712_c0_g1~~TRINITY_DN10712_c0_g1_i1.p1  ORF type:complete len:417 (+),score=61.49 TRINITY_DN10712_c0_g1_i1:93-1343(+)